MNEAAITLDGWYALHDFRSMDWATWKLLSEEDRTAAVNEFIAYLEKLKRSRCRKNRCTCFLHNRWSKSRFHVNDFT